MNRIVIAVLAVALAATLGAAGCVGPFGSPGHELEQHHSVSQRPPVVYPEQVNDANAHAKALALQAEMDFDTQNEPAAAPAKGPR